MIRNEFTRLFMDPKLKPVIPAYAGIHLLPGSGFPPAQE